MVGLDGIFRSTSNHRSLGASGKTHKLVRVDISDYQPEVGFRKVGIDQHRGFHACRTAIDHPGMSRIVGDHLATWGQGFWNDSAALLLT